MPYISINDSPEKNFFALATGTAFTTEEYAETYKEITNAVIPAKITALKMATLALVFFGLLVAATGGMVPGLLLISSALFPLIGAKYQSDKGITLISQPHYEISSIVKHMMDKLNELQLIKENFLIKNANKNNDDSSSAGGIKILTNIENEFDRGDYYWGSEAKEHAKWLPHVQAILLKKTPPAFPQDKWEELRKSCFTFVYGRGNNGNCQRFISGEDIKRLNLNPYVKVVSATTLSGWMVEKY